MALATCTITCLAPGLMGQCAGFGLQSLFTTAAYADAHVDTADVDDELPSLFRHANYAAKIAPLEASARATHGLGFTQGQRAGVSLNHVTYDGNAIGGGGKDTDFVAAGYLHAGLLWPIGAHARIGLDGMMVLGSDASLNGATTAMDYEQLSLVFEYWF